MTIYHTHHGSSSYNDLIAQEGRKGGPEQHDESYDYEYVMGDKVTNTEDLINEEGGDNKEENV